MFNYGEMTLSKNDSYKALNTEQASAALAPLLTKKQWTVTTIESCTGGGVSAAITDVAGSSAYFNQAYITYSNKAKSDLVGVNVDTLNRFGAVSEQTVKEMALGGLEKAHANISVAVSGVAGPGGGTEDKPIGTVWFAFGINDNNDYLKSKLTTACVKFTGSRKEVRDKAINYALNQVLTLLSEKK